MREAAERIGLPVVVQPMLQGGAELLAGVVQDPVFGPLRRVRPGRSPRRADRRRRVPHRPAHGRRRARARDERGRQAASSAGFRGAAPSSAAALADLVLRLSRLADDVDEVAELDLNPVLGLPDGYVAVDARILVRTPPHVLRTKGW